MGFGRPSGGRLTEKEWPVVSRCWQRGRMEAARAVMGMLGEEGVGKSVEGWIRVGGRRMRVRSATAVVIGCRRLAMANMGAGAVLGGGIG